MHPKSETYFRKAFSFQARLPHIYKHYIRMRRRTIFRHKMTRLREINIQPCSHFIFSPLLRLLHFYASSSADPLPSPCISVAITAPDKRRVSKCIFRGTFLHRFYLFRFIIYFVHIGMPYIFFFQGRGLGMGCCVRGNVTFRTH